LVNKGVAEECLWASSKKQRVKVSESFPQPRHKGRGNLVRWGITTTSQKAGLEPGLKSQARFPRPEQGDPAQILRFAYSGQHLVTLYLSVTRHWALVKTHQGEARDVRSTVSLDRYIN
jgi:hypothetical protein